MKIACKIEKNENGTEQTRCVFRFNCDQVVLEEFFFGDVPNFANEILETLQLGLHSKEMKSFSGNIGFLEVVGEDSTVGLLFGDQQPLTVPTVELICLVEAYEACNTKQ